MRLLLLHENPESMPHLAAALAARTPTEAIRIVNPWHRLRMIAGRDFAFGWSEYEGANWRRVAVVPGLRRSYRASAVTLRRIARRAIERHRPDAVLIESPYLAAILDVTELPVGYVAADTYEFYAWPPERTADLEQLLLDRAAVTFSVTHRLADDLAARGARDVVQLGTAVPASFIDAGRRDSGTPADLERVPRPRVGCAGIINGTYDWDLIERLAAARPDASFVFVGPIRERDARDAARIAQAFDRPNLHWLGPRRHADLPAYLAACDVLLNPLRPGRHSDRRFPLRLCEYMATERPVISTAIDELASFPADVAPIDATNGPARLDEAIDRPTVDQAARTSWLAENTWDARAATVLGSLERVLAHPGGADEQRPTRTDRAG